MTKLTLAAEAETIVPPDADPGLELATLTFYDIPALAALSVVGYGQPLTAEALWEATDEMRMYFDGAFGAPRDDSFVGAWLDGELVGAVFCALDPPFDGVPRGPFVLDLVVDPNVRRQGVAKALIAELAERVQKWGYDSLALRLDMAMMPEAYNLYQNLGFTEAIEQLEDNS